jgi:hypothetical protein
VGVGASLGSRSKFRWGSKFTWGSKFRRGWGQQLKLEQQVQIFPGGNRRVHVS